MNPVSARRRTLLIVDDDRGLAQMLGWAIEDMGYAVWIAADCDEAAVYANSLAFGCALVDYPRPTETPICCHIGSHSASLTSRLS